MVQDCFWCGGTGWIEQPEGSNWPEIEEDEQPTPEPEIDDPNQLVIIF